MATQIQQHALLSHHGQKLRYICSCNQLNNILHTDVLENNIVKVHTAA